MANLMEQEGEWPDPARPGVPLNPELDDWHWLKTRDGLQVPYEWRAAGECERGRWPNYWVPVHDDNWQAMECTYLGPVLSHNQTKALQARVAQLEAVLREMLYEATHLSPQEDDGSHWAKISKRTLEKARAALKDEPFP